MSFTDGLLAAPIPAAAQRARHDLQLTMAVTRAFLNEYLKGVPGSVMDAADGSEVIVRKYAP